MGDRLTGTPATYVQHDLSRVSVPELEAILGTSFKVLDDGFIRVIDYMGSDASIVQAARVSYGLGTKQVHEDRGLIRYLRRHAHTTPFEMCEIKFHVRVPMDCWRQWIRHRTANVNEYSTRYSVAIDAAQRTTPKAWRLQSTQNRQGSDAVLREDIGERLSSQEAQLQELSRKIYADRIRFGVAREQARKDLPLSTYTEAYWKIDLHNLLHFLRLRMDDHAQLEIRHYASVIGNEIVARWCPITWEAFLDYEVHALKLSSIEVMIAACMAQGRAEAAVQVAEERGLIVRDGKDLRPSRERRECEAKLERLGLSIPWL